MKKSSRTSVNFIATIALFFYITSSCYGQAKLPEVVPPSPNAYIFQKFTDVPVTYYSGLPSVSVPVYTIKTGDYQYPLSLSYHTGGIRAEDKASWVGLNWALNGVGMISRTTLDGADDVFNGFFYNEYDPYTLQNNLAELDIYEQLDFFRNKECYRYDLQPDMYYLNAGNMSVKFYMNKQKQVIQINKTNIRITPNFQGDPLNETYGTLKGFTVVDGDGTRYFFGNGLDEKMNIDLLNYGGCTRYNLYRSGWYLEKLITAKNDTIRFEYEADNTRYYSRPTTTLNFNSRDLGWYWSWLVVNFNCSVMPETSTSLTDVTVYGNRLKTIFFDAGRVDFFASPRLDVDAGNKKLDSIKVYNYLNRMITGCKLNYDYYSDVYTGLQSLPPPNPNELDTYKRLRLLSVKFFNNQTELPPYQFDYTNNTLPFKLSPAIDHWGYYNASNNNGGYMPYFLMNISAYSAPFHPLRRNSNAYRMSTDSMSRGALYKVTYPTGGHTQFEFEPNEVYMRNFIYNITFDQMPWSGEPSQAFGLEEINANPDTASEAQAITVTNQNPTSNFTLASQCGYRYVQITSADFPDYTNSNLRLKIDVFPSNLVIACKNVNEVDHYLWVLPDGQYTLQINLVDESGIPVQTIYDPVTVTLSVKQDILDFCQEKNRKVGGLRIKKMDTYDPVGATTIHKEYQYSDSVDTDRSSGSLTNKPIYFNSSRQRGNNVEDGNSYWCGYLHFSEKSHIGDSKTGGNVVGYNHVTELFAENGQQGKIAYDYISPKEMPDDFTYELDKYPFPPTASYEWARGLLVKKQVYRRTGSGYTMVQKDSTAYDINIANPAIEGVALGNNWLTNYNYQLGDPPSPGFCLLNIKEYDIPHGAVRQATNYHTEYDVVNGQSIATIEKRFYDNFPHEQPMRTETSDSKGNLVKTENKYPYDFAGTTVYDNMIARNIINPLVDQSTFKGTNFLQSTKTNFNDWGNGIIAPYTAEIKTGNNLSEVRLQFDGYDNKGNILSVSKKDDAKNTYIWGYNQSYPIAKVTNAQVKDVFHTSFEDAEGNSVDGDSKTGKKSRTGGYSRPLSNLTNGSYVLTWWQKSGSAWTFQADASIAVTNGSYTISLPGQVDEVRFYPAGAQMITYTYEPLEGMTSQCDVGNHITYYEYDAMGRLQLIRDQDRNILKRFCYNYAGQPENCAQ